MGLICGLLGLPLAPLRGTIAVAEQIQRQAEEEFYDPVTIRKQLEEVDRQRAAGELSDEEATIWEDELVERLMVARSRPRKGVAMATSRYRSSSHQRSPRQDAAEEGDQRRRRRAKKASPGRPRSGRSAPRAEADRPPNAGRDRRRSRAAAASS